MIYPAFGVAVVVVVAGLLLTRPAMRPTLALAAALLLLEVAAVGLVAATQATDCGRCSFGQELLPVLAFAVFPAALVATLGWALFGAVRASEPREASRG